MEVLVSRSSSRSVRRLPPIVSSVIAALFIAGAALISPERFASLVAACPAVEVASHPSSPTPRPDYL